MAMSPVRTILLGLPAEGFEPPTYGLQNRCTTTVLSRHFKSRDILARRSLVVDAGANERPAPGMPTTDPVGLAAGPAPLPRAPTAAHPCARTACRRDPRIRR